MLVSSPRLSPTPRLTAALAGASAVLSACAPGAGEAHRQRAAFEEDDAAACHAFAQRLREGDQVLRDRDRAAELIRRACELGHDPACPEDEDEEEDEENDGDGGEDAPAQAGGPGGAPPATGAIGPAPRRAGPPAPTRGRGKPAPAPGRGSAAR